MREETAKDSESGFTKAITECIDAGILQEYLQRKAKEVMNMLLAEYSYSTDVEVQREEARRQGKLEGSHQKALETARKMKADKIPIHSIVQYTELTIEEIEKIK